MFQHRNSIRAFMAFGVCSLFTIGIFIPGRAGSVAKPDAATATAMVRDPAPPVPSGADPVTIRAISIYGAAGLTEHARRDSAIGQVFIFQRNAPAADAPKIIKKIVAFPISTSNPDWPAYLRRAMPTAKYNPASAGYGIMQVAQAWAASGRNNNFMRDWCVARFRTALGSALSTWQADKNVTAFSSDSYLYCGDQVAAWVTVLNWFGDQLTTREKTDAAMILEQAVWNIWNPTKAKWGTKGYPWSGWATGDPLNNYFYRSHWKATLWWAIESQSPRWIDKVRNYCIPLLKSKYSQVVGGGSLEGTGYGQAYSELFQDIWIWRGAGGEDLSLDVRVPDQIEYWVRCTTPDYKFFAPIGDQSRVSIPAVWDYQRALICWGVALSPKTPEAAHGRHWLKHAGRKAARPENYWRTCLDTTGPEAEPAGNSYLAAGVGHLFAKSDDGAFLSMQAGKFTQSHDHADQGEVQIYVPAGWRFVTANIFSHSGIEQGIEYHNCVVFRTAAGKQINLQRSALNSPEMKVRDDGKLLTVTVDLKKAYQNYSDILTYTRTLTWDRSAKKVRISDEFTTRNGVTGTWRGTLAERPVSQPDGSLVAGPLTIRCKAKALPPVNWKTEARPKTFNRDCWRIEFTDANRYQVEISW